VIELGMPFTDPMADGPAIQAANLRSLGAGTRTADVLAIAKRLPRRHPDVPLVLMGYANTMTRPTVPEVRGDGARCRRRRDHLRRYPARGGRHARPVRRAWPRVIRLATPTTDAARLPPCSKAPSGFVYYVSVAGITGLQQAAQASIEDAVAQLKAATDLPVAVGFGVRTPEQAAAIGRVADGVVVGSAIVDLVGKHGEDAPAPSAPISNPSPRRSPRTKEVA
jgi:tryptophan synthase alpha chain